MRATMIVGTLAIALASWGCASTNGGGEDVEASEIEWPDEPDGEPRDLTPNDLDRETVLVESATILTAAGEEIPEGYLLIDEGKIRRVSAEPIDALRSVTAHPASVFGMGESRGRLEEGARANFVVWSGDPFELSTRVSHMFIDGEAVSLENRQRRLFERYRSLDGRAEPPEPVWGEGTGSETVDDGRTDD